MFIGFLKKEELSVYKTNGTGITLVTDKQPSQLRHLFDKKVLVISREITLYTRRNYPSIPISKLKKSLGLEVSEIFSIQSPQYYIKAFESNEKTTLIDIWCWQSEDLKKIRDIFPFQYIIPEDVLWIEEEPTVSIFKRDGIYHLIASNAGRFLGGLSLAELTDKEIGLFIAGLQVPDDILKIKIYGNILHDYKTDKTIERLNHPTYPRCFENLTKINLKDFRVRSHLPIKMDFLLRVPVYGLVAYAFFLYSSIQNYNSKISEVKTSISAIDKRISSFESTDEISNQQMVEEINKKISETVSPLSIMDILAERIPVGCIANRIVLSEKTLDIYLTYENPLDVIDFLEGADYIKTVTMKDAPVKQAGKNYNFTLSLELYGNIKN